MKAIDKIIDTLFKIQGGYALTILTNKKLIGIRDPFGIRPLVIGKLNKFYETNYDLKINDRILEVEGKKVESFKENIFRSCT